MNIEKLARLDLNLLICLKVLFDEENVTRAAHRLCLSQSAMSKSLAKLRLQFDDPLFTRTSHGLKPTCKAILLKPKLEVLIRNLEEINGPEKFNPTTSTKKFNIALVESVYPLILPHFLPNLFLQAPNIQISTHVWDDSTFDRLRSGEVDIGITGKDIERLNTSHAILPPKGIRELELYRDSQVCIVRKNHPILEREWSLETYLSLRHIQVRCDGHEKWLLDYMLSDLQHERDIAITVPDFNSAASLCTYTDFIFTAPSHFSELVAQLFGLVVLPLPIEFTQMAYTLFWHEERETDQSLDWLIKIIEERTFHLG